MENYDIVLKGEHLKIQKKATINVIKSNKCNQCDYASSRADSLRQHLKTHSGEKSNKCNQCDYASSRADHTRTHLKTHSRVKSNKCNQCDYASSHANHLRTHLKIHTGEKWLADSQWLCLISGRRFENTFIEGIYNIIICQNNFVQ